MTFKPGYILAFVSWASFMALAWLMILQIVSGVLPAIFLVVFFILAIAVAAVMDDRNEQRAD